MKPNGANCVGETVLLISMFVFVVVLFFPFPTETFVNGTFSQMLPLVSYAYTLGSVYIRSFKILRRLVRGCFYFVTKQVLGPSFVSFLFFFLFLELCNSFSKLTHPVFEFTLQFTPSEGSKHAAV